MYCSRFFKEVLNFCIHIVVLQSDASYFSRPDWSTLDSHPRDYLTVTRQLNVRQ